MSLIQLLLYKVKSDSEVIFYFQSMTKNIYALVLIALLVAGTLTQAADSTTLTYFVDYEEEQEDDYIEVQLLVQSQSQQLASALSNAKQTATQVASTANDFCKRFTKKGKGDCKEAVDLGTYNIEPKYQLVRKENVFTAFVVSYEITVNVYAPDNIGQLIDSMIKFDDLTMKGFEWKPLEEKDSEEEAIKEGVKQGQSLCEQIGLNLGRIIGVEQVKEEDDKEEDKGDEEQEEEQQPQITTYKFEVECVKKGAAKAK